ncbi:MAG: hypothetical protein H0W66_10195 [Chthoniobacterales bacterium]|nr:hypothetical protein [Chthoniobacterales bacterium]
MRRSRPPRTSRYNGWGRYGLAQSMKAQSKTDEAERVQRRFEEVWEYSDLESPFASSRSVAARE